MSNPTNTGTARQKAMETNRMCLTGLNDLFNLLRDSNALIGRIGLCVVIDTQRLPTLLADDLHPFMAHSLDAVGFGYLHCVSTVSKDDDYMFLEMGALSEEPETWHDGEVVPAPSNDLFPYIEEVRSVVYAISEITGSALDAITAAKADSDERMRNSFAKHAADIRDALFSGETGDAPLKVLH